MPCVLLSQRGGGGPQARTCWMGVKTGNDLGSGLIDQSQKMTVAAMQMADMKVCAQRS